MSPIASKEFDQPEQRDITRLIDDRVRDILGGQERAARGVTGVGVGVARQGPGVRASGLRGAGEFARRTGKAFARGVGANVVGRFLNLLPSEISAGIQGGVIAETLAAPLEDIPKIGKKLRRLATAGGAAIATAAEFERKRLKRIDRRNLARLNTLGVAGLKPQTFDVAGAVTVAAGIAQTLTNIGSAKSILEVTDRLKAFEENVNDALNLGTGALEAAKVFTDTIAEGGDIGAARTRATQRFYNANPYVVPPGIFKEFKELHESQLERFRQVPVTFLGPGDG